MSVVHVSLAGVRAAIVDAIEAGGNAAAEDYDLDAIAYETHEYDSTRGGFVLIVDESTFWESVERHERQPR